MSFMPFDFAQSAFDRLTTNGIDNVPFVVSLSKDLSTPSLGPTAWRVLSVNA